MAENTYLIFHPARLAYLLWYIIGIIVIVVGVLLFFDIIPISTLIEDYNTYFLIFFTAFGIILIGIAEILRKNDKYAITNFRIIEKRGIFNIKENSIYWEKVANYSLTQNLLDRIFRVGTIKLWSMGGGGEGVNPEVIVRRAPHIKKIRFLLDKLIQKR
ncbi:MAG: PH domain-containing protein [Candidatus Aenigmarchaeota archaeon]|nr:PH domain-containing protein [Candidatus Aenigmarchaeota archaeon]